MSNYCKNCYELQEQLDQLKAENEILKEKLVISSNSDKKTLKIIQTLTEIKDICNNNDELQCDFNLADCDKYKLGKHNLANKILQKISECEVNNDNK